MSNHPTDDDFNPDEPHAFWQLAGSLCVCLRLKSHPIHGMWELPVEPTNPRKAPPERVMAPA